MVKAARISRHKYGKVVRPPRRPALPQGHIRDTKFLLDAGRPKAHNTTGLIKSMENPVTPSGIETATFF
jgi:hypothetical protein